MCTALLRNFSEFVTWTTDLRLFGTSNNYGRLELQPVILSLESTSGKSSQPAAENMKAGFAGFSIVILIVSCLSAAGQKAKRTGTSASPVLWEAGDIESRDLFWGAGGREMFPNTKRVRFIDRKVGGANLKFEVEDGSRRRWVVKAADESQPEVVANRLLWAIGYKTEIDYVVNTFQAPHFGRFYNVRFELRSDNVERADNWSWKKNPFVGTRELAGLKLFMAIINNWDLKDENNRILITEGRAYHIVSDLGASFGKLANNSTSRSGRSVNSPKDYTSSSFIKEVRNGVIELDYRGRDEGVVKGIKIEDGRWLANLLTQLTDRQIEDAFRAAKYGKKSIRIYSRAFRKRINALDAATSRR